MKKILFVDDEPNILDGLRRMLRPLRNEFAMSFAGSGTEALEMMAGERFDTVVSDMRMPGMDGAELLEIIKDTYPHAIRIMLTGQADEPSILRTVGVVHQFLAKPCDPQTLKTVLIKASALQEILSDGGLKDIISQVGTLPSLPSVYTRLKKAMENPEVEISDVARIIELDISMSAKILQLVNSAFFGLFTRIETPAMAVKLLGLDTIRNLVLGIEIFQQARMPPGLIKAETLWSHSLMVGKLAKAIAVLESDDKELINNAFLAGMLHDIGKIIMAANLADDYARAIALARQNSLCLHQAEREILGAGHGAVGAYLVGLWGFKGPIVEGIGFHHELERYPADAFTPALAVHVANCLYYQHYKGEIIGQPQTLQTEALERLGLGGRIPGWEQVCGEILASHEDGNVA